tara:strand:+ start:418 stop:1212 length:795 start_codon:yes stop_codon:yes gene_type:complete
VLVIENIEVTYHHTVQALRGLSLEVPKGKIVALLGSNGAGKTTTLKAASGLLELENGQIGEGKISFDNQSIKGIEPDKLVRQGLFHVREGRRIFSEMTVEENLWAASYALQGRSLKPDFEVIFDFFPLLKERNNLLAGYLSGGEQQMLAIARAMIAKPKLILFDEPSLGLAPKIVDSIINSIKRLNEEQGVTILIVEQNAVKALGIADYGYILENGVVVLEGDVKTLQSDRDIQSFYLGVSERDGGRISFRDVKHYKRRKRWLS